MYDPPPLFREASALNGNGVDELFFEIGKAIMLGGAAQIANADKTLNRQERAEEEERLRIQREVR